MILKLYADNLNMELSQQINAAHQSFERSGSRSLEYAIQAGELLAKAKKNVGHGEFTKWVNSNCKFSVRTAQVYGQVFKHRRDIAKDAEALRLYSIKQILEKIKLKDRKKKIDRQLKQDHTEPPRSIKMVCSDFRDVKIKAKSVDLILTDPLWHKKNVGLWSDLSKFAARVLKPGGLVVAYCGTLVLASAMARLGENLDYIWTLSINTGAGHYMRGENGFDIRTAWRAVIIFSKGRAKKQLSFCDVLKCRTNEDFKKYHPYQQPLSECERLVSNFSKANDLVVDCMSGSHTTGVASYNLGRRYLGIDIDKECLKIGKLRIAEAMKEKESSKAA